MSDLHFLVFWFNPLGFVLSCLSTQIRGLPLWCISSCQLGALLCPGRSVDAERLAGGHAGYRSSRSSEARANWFLPLAGRQRPVSSQRGTGPVDGHSPVATAVSLPVKTEVNEKERGARCMTSQDAITHMWTNKL